MPRHAAVQPCADEIRILVKDAVCRTVIPDADVTFSAFGPTRGSGAKGRIFTRRQLFEPQDPSRDPCEGATLGVAHSRYHGFADLPSPAFRLGQVIEVLLQPKRTYAGLDRVRLRVYGSGGFGHRVAAVLALRNLRHIQFGGTVDLLYPGDRETCGILKKLLPDFAFDGNAAFQADFGGLTVHCYRANVDPLPAIVDPQRVLGLVAACDEEGAVTAADFGAGVSQFVILQPYRYRMSGHRRLRKRRSEEASRETFLDENLLYRFTPPPYDDPAAFVNGKLAQDPRRAGLQRLMAEVANGAVHLLPVYGLRGAGIPPDADTENMVANIVAGARRYAADRNVQGPVVVLMLNDHDTVHPVAADVRCVTIQDLPAALDGNGDHATRVFYVRCGGLAFDVFECLLSWADLPPVTEGNNTINQLLLMRQPFLSAGTRSTSFPSYPQFEEQRARAEQLATDLHTRHEPYVATKTPLTELALAVLDLRRLAAVAADRVALRTLIRGHLSDTHPIDGAAVNALDGQVRNAAREALEFLCGCTFVVGGFNFEYRVSQRAYFPESLREGKYAALRRDMDAAQIGGLQRRNHPYYGDRFVAMEEGGRVEGRLADDLAERIRDVRRHAGAALAGAGLDAVLDHIFVDAALPIALDEEGLIANAPNTRQRDDQDYGGNFADWIADRRVEQVRRMCTEYQRLNLVAGVGSLAATDAAVVGRIASFIHDALTPDTDLRRYFTHLWDEAADPSSDHLLNALDEVREPGDTDGAGPGYVADGNTIRPG